MPGTSEVPNVGQDGRRAIENDERVDLCIQLVPFVALLIDEIYKVIMKAVGCGTSYKTMKTKLYDSSTASICITHVE